MTASRKPVPLAAWPILACLPLGLSQSCGPAEETDAPVARAYNEVLRWSELRTVVPVDLAPEDSAALAQRYINDWLRQRVLLHQAETNLAGQGTDHEALLRDYRNSLVIYAYEKALVEQKLDTLVPMAEIERYYEENLAAFELQDDIMRVRWAKVRDDDKRTMKRLEDHFLSGSPERMQELEIWLAQRGIPIVDRSDTWSTRAGFEAESSVALPETDKPGRRVIKREGNTWFIDVLELRPRGSTEPLERARMDIRSILLNQRKLRLIEAMREDIYHEAVERKDIETYR